MRILVTGGAGFIGSHVVDAYIQAGHEVAVLDNLSTGRRELVHPQARFYKVDLRDGRAVREVLEEFRPQVVNHHAAQASVVVSLENPVEDAQNNIIGSIHLLEACRRVGIEKFIYISTGGAVYGDPEPEALPVSEDYPPRPLSPYGAGKLAVENYVRLYALNLGFRYTILRYGNVYGPRQDPLGEAGVIAIFLHRIATGQPCIIYGNGHQTRDFVYVEDVARANLLALERGDGGIYNIGTGQETSVLEVIHHLRRAWDGNGEVEFAPPRPGEVFRIALDVRRAARELGWRARFSISQGIQAYVEWHRRQGGVSS